MTGRSREQAEVWKLADLDDMGAAGWRVEGSPRVVAGPDGTALAFDGEGDSLWLERNPLVGLAAFTLEVVFRPAAAGLPEQRFLHLGETHGDRLLFETRLTGAGAWYLDTFIRSGGVDSTLLNQSCLHPVDRWHHLALVCDGQGQTNYVNACREAEHRFSYQPAVTGRAAIGVRLNRVCWFQGTMASIRLTRRALDVRDFAARAAAVARGPDRI
jgi:hypothetical protein